MYYQYCFDHVLIIIVITHLKKDFSSLITYGNNKCFEKLNTHTSLQKCIRGWPALMKDFHK